MSALRHTAHGYWLEEAGPVEAAPALAGDLDADVVVIGGGYTGLWSAWFIHARDPDARVVLLEADRCGHGPSGRNGGFVSALWRELAELRARFGDDEALAVGHASGAAVRDIGAWCAEQGVDAWYRAAGHLNVAGAPAQEGGWDAAAAACAELGVPRELEPLAAEEVAARCASPAMGAGAFMRTGATVQPARLALGLRARLLAQGVQIHEHSRVRRLADGPRGVLAETAAGRVRAQAAVLAAGAEAAGIGPLRRRVAVGSSHIVLTEPVPDVLEELGWTGGEAITDARTFLHYFRPTPDGRIAFGWAGGHLAPGGRPAGRIELDPVAVAGAARALVRFFPALAARRVTHAWGGPVDVSPTHLPFLGTLAGGRVHYATGFTGNGVGPSHLAGRILAALALDRREPVTRLAIVEPPAVRFPPEPAAFLGGELVRAGTLRAERLEEQGRRVDPPTRWLTALPRRLGVHVGR